MKTVLLLLLAMLATKTTSVTTAVGQNACSKPYIGCMDRCVSRPTATLQNSCIEACQTQNNACFSQMLGAPGPAQTIMPAQTIVQEPETAQAAASEEPAAEEPARKSAKSKRKR